MWIKINFCLLGKLVDDLFIEILDTGLSIKLCLKT